MLNELAKEIREINTTNGWTIPTPDDFIYEGNDDAIPAKLALVHSEVSEALEAYRAGDIKNFAEELADTLIRVLDLACGLELNIDKAVRDKLEKNKGRGYRHGGKRV